MVVAFYTQNIFHSLRTQREGAQMAENDERDFCSSLFSIIIRYELKKI